jgi:hypothetical protein
MDANSGRRYDRSDAVNAVNGTFDQFIPSVELTIVVVRTVVPVRVMPEDSQTLDAYTTSNPSTVCVVPVALLHVRPWSVEYFKVTASEGTALGIPASYKEDPVATQTGPSVEMFPTSTSKIPDTSVQVVPSVERFIRDALGPSDASYVPPSKNTPFEYPNAVPYAVW